MKLRSERRRDELMGKYASLIASMRMIHGEPTLRGFREGFDIHHIVPASTFPGGRSGREANTRDNLCWLTYRQHYIAHMLLAAIDPHQTPTIVLPYRTMARKGTSRQFEQSRQEKSRERHRQRSREGLARARASGKSIGRPVAAGRTEAVAVCKAQGMSQSETAAQLGCSLRTVKRHWKPA